MSTLVTLSRTFVDTWLDIVASEFMEIGLEAWLKWCSTCLANVKS